MSWFEHIASRFAASGLAGFADFSMADESNYSYHLAGLLGRRWFSGSPRRLLHVAVPLFVPFSFSEGLGLKNWICVHHPSDSDFTEVETRLSHRFQIWSASFTNISLSLQHMLAVRLVLSSRANPCESNEQEDTRSRQPKIMPKTQPRLAA